MPRLEKAIKIMRRGTIEKIVNVSLQSYADLQIQQSFSLTFFATGPHKGRISKLEVLATTPSGNASLPKGQH